MSDGKKDIISRPISLNLFFFYHFKILLVPSHSTTAGTIIKMLNERIRAATMPKISDCEPIMLTYRIKYCNGCQEKIDFPVPPHQKTKLIGDKDNRIMLNIAVFLL